MPLGFTFDPATDLANPDVYPSDDYASALNTIAPNTTDIIQQQQQPGESWTQTLLRTLPALAATYEQKQLLDEQVSRAKQGLPPLNTSQYGLGVNVGLSSQTLLMIGGAIVVGFLLLKR